MLTLRTLNLISIQSWTYLLQSGALSLGKQGKGKKECVLFFHFPSLPCL